MTNLTTVCLLGVLAVVLGACVPGSAAQRLPAFPKAYTASFSRHTTFSSDYPSIVTKDGTFTQSAELNSTKQTGILVGEVEVDLTELYLYNQRVGYSWLTYWGLCTKRDLSAYEEYWDPLFGVQYTSYVGLTQMNGQVAQLWAYAHGNVTWDFYVTNDANQFPLRVYLNSSGSGYDILYSSFKPGVSSDAFKPAGSCSWTLFNDDRANGDASVPEKQRAGTLRRSDEAVPAARIEQAVAVGKRRAQVAQEAVKLRKH